MPYVTAELTASDVNQWENFVVGDGRNYGQGTKRKRRMVDGQKTASLFYNRPLKPNSVYSAFQRTFVDKVRDLKLIIFNESHCLGGWQTS